MVSFGPFTVDVLRRTVAKNGTPLRLTLKCTELLIALVTNAGKPLTKEQLLEAAWPNADASDATLAQHVFLLRRALRHDAVAWIRTIPNVGYCFDAPVSVRPAAEDERTRAVRTYLESASKMRELGTERSLRAAVDLCARAIALDDRCAGAYALRAECWRLLAHEMYAEPLPCLQAAKQDAAAALALDPHRVDAHLEAAIAAASCDRDHAAARRELDAAADLAPRDPRLAHWRVWLALMDGRHEEAVALAQQTGGPLHAGALYMAGKFSAARQLLEEAAAIDENSRVIRGACRLFTGDSAAAIEDFHAVYYAPQAQNGAGARHYALGLYIYTLAKMGRVEEARQRARTLERLRAARYVSPMALAAAYLGLGDRDRAFALMEEARSRFDPWSAYLLADPLLAELRADPRFAIVSSKAA